MAGTEGGRTRPRVEARRKSTQMIFALVKIAPQVPVMFEARG